MEVDRGFQDLLDKAAVHETVLSYARGVDQRDWDLVSSCFDPNGYVEGTKFEAPVSEYLPALRRGVEAWRTTLHFMGNHLVDLGEDGAHAETYAVAYHYFNTNPETPDLVMAVRYLDHLTKPSERWVITRRVVRSAWTREGEQMERP